MLQGVPIRSVREKPLDLITYRPLVKEGGGGGGLCVEVTIVFRIEKIRAYF